MKLSETRDKDGNIVPAKLDQFIAEREGQIGDREAFERIIRLMAGKSKATPGASSPGDCDD